MPWMKGYDKLSRVRTRCVLRVHAMSCEVQILTHIYLLGGINMIGILVTNKGSKEEICELP